MCNRALFFYQSCAAELEDELGETIAAHQADLKEIVGGTAGLNPDVRQHVVPVEKVRRRDSDSSRSWSWWSRVGVVAVAVLMVMIVFQPAPEFEITDTNWQRNGEEVVVNCLLHNRAESAKLLTVQFLADFSTAGGFD